MSEIKKNLAYNLTRILEERKIPRLAFAKGLGMTRQTVCNVTHGKSAVSAKTLKRIADFLGVNELDLISDFDDFSELRRALKTIMPPTRRTKVISHLIQEARRQAHLHQAKSQALMHKY